MTPSGDGCTSFGYHRTEGGDIIMTEVITLVLAWYSGELKLPDTEFLERLRSAVETWRGKHCTKQVAMSC